MRIQKPSLGRVVIFTAFRGHEKTEVDEYAGIIVKVHTPLSEGARGLRSLESLRLLTDEEKSAATGRIDIKTFGSSSTYDNHNVEHGAEGKTNTWRYPTVMRDEIEVAS